MYVCVCNGVTDKDIQREVDAGCESLSDITMNTGLGANCGSCVTLAETLIEGMRMKAAMRDLDVPVLGGEVPMHFFAATQAA